ncbi:hypothetical protein COO60DRAFT_1485872 [Scenedesmus sp. NREL 46B-D3]|nr:hypothetical protein COO60DRAFT_1485872 [Scenedesmus sp. NREL 46B-D3]
MPGRSPSLTSRHHSSSSTSSSSSSSRQRKLQVQQGPQRLQKQFSRLLRHRPSATDYGEAYENLFRSKVFQSDLVVKEFDSIMTELRQLSMMASRFPEFDVAGKEMFLDKMEEGSERYKLFMKRLELCDDPAAREYLRYTNAQMLEGGFTMQVMFEGLTQSLGQYRTWLEEERRVSSDPAKHQAFLAGFRQAWSSSAMGAIDMSVLAQMADPEVVVKAQKDPEFYKCIREISDNPTSETMSKWLDHPTIGPFVGAMWKSMQAARNRGQQ